MNLWHMSAHYGQQVSVSHAAARPLLFARNDDEEQFVTEMLRANSYIHHEGSFTEWTCTLTPAGWNRVADLRSRRVGQRMDQAFVAMWFGDEKPFCGRSSREFCLDTLNRGIGPGVGKAGYRPQRIDYKEFNGDIMDAVMAEIRRSRFVVADFTGHRPGVYYEAGFALGLGLPVIFTCHKSQFDRAHFDTNHMNHIVWEEPADLAKRLTNRILATVGQGPRKPEEGRA
jgi:hypothetical protein